MTGEDMLPSMPFLAPRSNGVTAFPHHPGTNRREGDFHPWT
jgi:hypothetical protein